MSELTIIDLPPEDGAMLQALYSRSAAPVATHLEKVHRTGSGKFMKEFYVGYNHQSIGDCGTSTAYVEHVSLLAAKAIQDWPLYSGQETSTRYIDMAAQPIVDPVATPASRVILDAWMAFYTHSQERVAAEIRKRCPQRSTEDPIVYGKAVKARTFDVLRGFLPAGITTQLSWHTNLRQGNEHLRWMRHHPAPEIAVTAENLRGVFAERFPSSGFDKVAKPAVEAWQYAVAQAHTYFTVEAHAGKWTGLTSTVYHDALAPYAPMLQARPRDAVLPHFLTELGQFTWRSTLDFGSFRDLQRHRNGVCRMPLLRLHHGFEPWYLDQLDDALRGEAEALIATQQARIEALTLDDGTPVPPALVQYYVALGYRVPVQVTYALPALVYVMELRSGKMIHPTLRTMVHALIHEFKRLYPEVTLHVDLDPNDWDVRRGTQTITART